jgi:DNA-binding protein HU-alpha
LDFGPKQVILCPGKENTPENGAVMAATPKKRSTSTRKTATTGKTTAAAKTTAKVPEPKVVQLVDPVVSEPELKKKELVELVVERTGVKKRDAKPSVEAALAILGEAIASGREMNLPPLGKIRINRSADNGNTKVTICKIRQSTGKDENESGDPLAEAGE